MMRLVCNVHDAGNVYVGVGGGGVPGGDFFTLCFAALLACCVSAWGGK